MKPKKANSNPVWLMLTVMPQSHTLSNHSRLSPSAKYQTLLDCFLADFQKSLNALARAWNKYQPNDSLSNDRKQDLDWLETTLQEYKISIHTSTSSQEFWKGCRDGKKAGEQFQTKARQTSHKPYSTRPRIRKSLKSTIWGSMLDGGTLASKTTCCESESSESWKNPSSFKIINSF